MGMLLITVGIVLILAGGLFFDDSWVYDGVSLVTVVIGVVCLISGVIAAGVIGWTGFNIFVAVVVIIICCIYVLGSD